MSLVFVNIISNIILLVISPAQKTYMQLQRNAATLLPHVKINSWPLATQLQISMQLTELSSCKTVCQLYKHHDDDFLKELQQKTQNFTRQALGMNLVLGQ